MKKNIIKKIVVCILTICTAFSLTACNNVIKVTYSYNPDDYLTLADYDGIEVVVDMAGIEDGLIKKRIQADTDEYTEYSEVSRGAQDGDQVNLEFNGLVNGYTESAFSSDDYSLILGTDTFVIDGFVDELYGMKTGDFKIVTLTIPEDFSDDAFAGKKIVYEITMVSVKQPVVPMLTDGFLKEKFDVNSYDEYIESIKSDLKDVIDEQVLSAKKQALFDKLYDACEFKGYPEDEYNKKYEEYEKSMNFYALMMGGTPEEYCEITFNMTLEEYTKRALGIEMIFAAVIQKENLDIREYEYKDSLEGFAKESGYSDKDSFVEKFGKDYIVKAMLNSKAQDTIMNKAVFIQE